MFSDYVIFRILVVMVVFFLIIVGIAGIVRLLVEVIYRITKRNVNRINDLVIEKIKEREKDKDVKKSD